MKKLLSETNPELREEWHPSKNDELIFDEVCQTTSRKAWWHCKNDPPHEWQATIRSRAISKNGCPFCSGRFVSLDKSIVSLFPEIAAEWHPTKNENLKPEQVAPHTMKRVWWQCKLGHEWHSKINYRTTTSSKCPECALIAKSLAITHPDISTDWHQEKNLPLTPYKVSHGMSKLVWWKCLNGHEWQSQIASRVSSLIGCPFCAKHSVNNTRLNIALSESNPELATQWHPTMNLPLTPEKVSPGASKKTWWICPHNNKHIWQSTVRNRVKGKGCPHCLTGPSLAEKFPELAKEWHPSKNGSMKATDITYGSARRVWWQCSVNPEHEFESTVTNRTSRGKKKGCPICSGVIVTPATSLEFNHPEVAKEWDTTKNEGLTPKDVTRASGKKVWWICSVNPSHEWQAQIKNRTVLGSGCPICGIKRLQEALYESAQANAEFYKTFTKSIESLRNISNQEFPQKGAIQQPLFKMIYASTITAMETYLCDAFLHKVTNNEELIDKLLTSMHEFKEKKYSITEILDWKNQTRKKVSEYLLDIVWHNLPKVHNLYENVLGIAFPSSIERIHKYIAIRHDLVHRNGRTKSGRFHIIKLFEIEALFEDVESFVQHIDERVNLLTENE